jgi:tetratricopeptide (TPR) repeat protein
MRSSSAAGFALLVASAGSVAATQPRLAALAHSAKEHEEVYALPPPLPLHVATLGWDAAAVDLLWSKLLMEYGTHWEEHRDFKSVPNYIDAIIELEPSFGPLYRHVDTLLAYRPLQGSEEDARLARAYLERGTRERPYDARVWEEYGQFMAFMGPSFLHDPAERDGWRKDGALAMGHAVDFGANAVTALTAATILTERGGRDQAIAYLRRAYAFTEDRSMGPVHEAIGRRLASLEHRAWNDAADAARNVVERRWTREMPFVSPDLYVLLGPHVDPLRCAGIDAEEDPRCSRDWSAVVSEGVKEPGWSEDSP